MVQNLEDILDRLEAWRKERFLDASQGFEFNLKTQVSFLTEEITEYLRAKNDNDKIDALCDLTVFSLNVLSLKDNALENYIHFFNGVLKREESNDYSIIDILKYTTSILLEPYKYDFYGYLIVSDCYWLIKNMDYDYFKCMEETLKEIESRKGALNPDTGKWEKFKDEESQKLWYKADYKSCKIMI